MNYTMTKDGAKELRYGSEGAAQLIIVPYLAVSLERAEVLGDTERGTGGFGSTGVE